MSVKLGKYLKAQRNRLDVETPDDSVIWAGVEEGLNAGKSVKKNLSRRITLIRIRNIAAVVIILFSLGYIANDFINKDRSETLVTLSSIDSELGRREKEYKMLVDFKTEEVSSSKDSRDININELFQEIKKLDLVYDQAMKDLKELGPDEKVINTIFSTYEQRIRLLELIILETNKLKSHENKQKIIL